MTSKPAKKRAIIAAMAVDSKKAEDILVLDLLGKSSLADFLILASADSAAQMNAVGDAVDKALKEEGVRRLYTDGSESASWKVLDYGEIIVHVFSPETRNFYALDKLYHWAKAVKWMPSAGLRPAGRAKTKRTAPRVLRKRKNIVKRSRRNAKIL